MDMQTRLTAYAKQNGRTLDPAGRITVPTMEYRVDPSLWNMGFWGTPAQWRRAVKKLRHAEAHPAPVPF